VVDYRGAKVGDRLVGAKVRRLVVCGKINGTEYRWCSWLRIRDKEGDKLVGANGGHEGWILLFVPYQIQWCGIGKVVAKSGTEYTWCDK